MDDATYWGRDFGVMLFKDSLTKENLLNNNVQNETNALYIQGIKEQKSLSFVIIGIACDAKKELIQSFGKIPVPHCVSSINQQLFVDI